MKRNSDTMSKEESINEQLKLEFPSKSRKRYSEEVKFEIDNDILRSPLHCTPNNQEQAEFNEMVHAYKVHQRMMQLSFSNIDEFLDEHEEGPKLRKMDPSDVKQLSEVEFAGLIYWIDKQKPYGELPSEDKSALLTRYSVRKLSLDHFYSASKYPDHVNFIRFLFFLFSLYFSVPEESSLWTTIHMSQVIELDLSNKMMMNSRLQPKWRKLKNTVSRIKVLISGYFLEHSLDSGIT